MKGICLIACLALVSTCLTQSATALHRKSDYKGQRYPDIVLGEDTVRRLVKVESGKSILELTFPAHKADGMVTTIYNASLENYDTLTALPLVVKRNPKHATVVKLSFPPEAGVTGGGAAIDFIQGNKQAGGGGIISDQPDADVRLEKDGDGFSVAHNLKGRTLEFEVIWIDYGGKLLANAAGKTVRVESDQRVLIPGVSVDWVAGKGTQWAYKYRILPNAKWHTVQQ